VRELKATDARDMASLHAESFERLWDALEMAAHTQKDMCLGQAEILTLTTALNARRQGLARQLLDQASSVLKKQKITELFLEVAEDNAAAIALYRSAGFTPIGRRPAYYRRKAGRIAALTFSKKLA